MEKWPKVHDSDWQMIDRQEKIMFDASKDMPVYNLNKAYLTNSPRYCRLSGSSICHHFFNLRGWGSIWRINEEIWIKFVKLTFESKSLFCWERLNFRDILSQWQVNVEIKVSGEKIEHRKMFLNADGFKYRCHLRDHCRCRYCWRCRCRCRQCLRRRCCWRNRCRRRRHSLSFGFISRFSINDQKTILREMAKSFLGSANFLKRLICQTSKHQNIKCLHVLLSFYFSILIISIFLPFLFLCFSIIPVFISFLSYFYFHFNQSHFFSCSFFLSTFFIFSLSLSLSHPSAIFLLKLYLRHDLGPSSPSWIRSWFRHMDLR